MKTANALHLAIKGKNVLYRSLLQGNIGKLLKVGENGDYLWSEE